MVLELSLEEKMEPSRYGAGQPTLFFTTLFEQILRDNSNSFKKSVKGNDFVQEWNASFNPCHQLKPCVCTCLGA